MSHTEPFAEVVLLVEALGALARASSWNSPAAAADASEEPSRWLFPKPEDDIPREEETPETVKGDTCESQLSRPLE